MFRDRLGVRDGVMDGVRDGIWNEQRDRDRVRVKDILMYK